MARAQTIGGIGAALGRRALPRDRALSVKMSMAMMALALLAVGPLTLFAVWAMGVVDREAAERERLILERTLAELPQDVVLKQQNVTIWDDAVRMSRTHNHTWMADNLSLWFHEYTGIETVIVLDHADRPIHAMRSGTLVDPLDVARDLEGIAPLLADLRGRLRTTADPGEEGAQAFMRIFGEPSLVSVQAIVPESPLHRFAPAATYLHVAVERLGPKLFEAIGAQYMIDDIRIEAPDAAAGAAGIPVHGSDGTLLGRIAWTPAAPGAQLLARAWPGVLASVAMLLGLAAWMLLRLRRSVLRLRASEARTRHLAYHDVLTGLPNRAMFDQRLERAMRALERGEGPETLMALHAIDLDRFKLVNDTLGHPAGDELIRQVGLRLRGLVRGGDTVARIGGDEFAIIQADLVDAEEARSLGARVLVALRAPFQLDGDEAFVDSSIGTVLAPAFGTDRFELMRKADIALYEAKAAGKGCQRLFEAQHDAAVRRKVLLERNLRDDLAQGTGFRLVYQPVFAADGLRLIGAEALARWDNAELGSIAPLDFIPMAEERGLIQELGARLLREACEGALAFDLPQVAVNISAVQFRDPRFVDLVLDLLKEVGLSPERLEIEITEGLLLEATDDVARALTKLRFAGVAVALDDFGTGYSSLKYLHRYKVDRIKIDRSFVQSLGTAEGSEAIVQAMIDLARALDLSVTAEGVETEAQRRRLEYMGGPDLQGYLLGAPMEAAVLAAHLAPARARLRSG